MGKVIGVKAVKPHKKTQRDKVLDYIRKHGYITSWQAYQDLGVSQLGQGYLNLKSVDIVLKLNALIREIVTASLHITMSTGWWNNGRQQKILLD